MLTLGSNNPSSKKLCIRQNIRITSRGILPITYLVNSHAQGKPWVVLITHPQRELSIPAKLTRKSSTTIWFKAYLDTKPISFFYKVTLKTCSTICILVSKDALISVCCSVIMLFMTSQTPHRSPRLFNSSLFKAQLADLTLHFK